MKPHARDPKLAKSAEHVKARPTKVITVWVVPLLTEAQAKAISGTFRNQSDSIPEVTEYAEIEGMPRTNIATFVHERLISSENTNPRRSARYAGRNSSVMVFTGKN
jgi:hypothetical protein